MVRLAEREEKLALTPPDTAGTIQLNPSHGSYYESSRLSVNLDYSAYPKIPRRRFLNRRFMDLKVVLTTTRKTSQILRGVADRPGANKDWRMTCQHLHDDFLLELCDQFTFYSDVPWIHICRYFICASETLLTKDGERTIYQGDVDDGLIEDDCASPCITWMDFLHAVVLMFLEDPGLMNLLQYGKDDEIKQVSKMYAMLDDQYYTARRQHLKILSEHKGMHCMENEWHSWLLIHVLTYVLHIPNVLQRHKTYHGDICEILLGRAMTTKRYNIVDWVQGKYTMWHWSTLVYHVVVEDGPRWLSEFYPPYAPVERATVDDQNRILILPKDYHPNAPVVPVGQLTKEGMKKARIREGGQIKDSIALELMLLIGVPMAGLYLGSCAKDAYAVCVQNDPHCMEFRPTPLMQQHPRFCQNLPEPIVQQIWLAIRRDPNSKAIFYQVSGEVINAVSMQFITDGILANIKHYHFIFNSNFLRSINLKSGLRAEGHQTYAAEQDDSSSGYRVQDPAWFRLTRTFQATEFCVQNLIFVAQDATFENPRNYQSVYCFAFSCYRTSANLVLIMNLALDQMEQGVVDVFGKVLEAVGFIYYIEEDDVLAYRNFTRAESPQYIT